MSQRRFEQSETIAEPGTIVLSYETFSLVRDVVAAHPLPPIHVKGISREVVPYVLDGLRERVGGAVISEHGPGLDVFVDLNQLQGAAVHRAREVLESALAALAESQATASG